MTPLALEMLIWFCTRTPEAGVFKNLKTHEPQKEIRNWMLADGIIEPCDPHGSEPLYSATEKGRAWLRLICATQMPVRQWTEPRSDGFEALVLRALASISLRGHLERGILPTPEEMEIERALRLHLAGLSQ